METGLLVVEQADDIWSKCVVSGFGSGEVVVEHVRDPLLDDHGETLDPGAPDKRAFVYEGEFAQILTVTGREKSTLSSLLRNAWDGTRPLSNLTKRSKLRATNAHISILAGITPTELRASMSEVQIHGGFLNRFLLVYVERKHLISRPQGIPKAVVTDHADEIKRAIEFGRNKALLRSDGEAEELFDRAYRTVLSVERPGLLGAACSRAESHVLRLAAIYSLLDQSETIKKKHVAAALALWRYCEASAALVFGEDAWSGEADLLLNELIDRGEMSRTEIRDHYQRNKRAEEIEAMLRSLLSLDLIEIDKQQTNGRAREVVRPKRHDNLVIHRDADCTSTRGWVAHDGVVRCWDCKPPALAGEVVSEVNYSTEKEAS